MSRQHSALAATAHDTLTAFIAGAALVASFVVSPLHAQAQPGYDAPKFNAVLNGKCLPSTGTLRTKLNDEICLQLQGTDPIDKTRYAVFLDGREMKNLPVERKVVAHAVVFTLTRNDQNKDAWVKILGSPIRLNTPVELTIDEVQEESGKPSMHTAVLIGDKKQTKTELDFVLIDGWRAFFAVAGVVLVVALVWGTAKNSALLRDPATPLLPPSMRPYSLGRWQMAFWFTLIFAAWVFLWVLTGDYNTISPESLTLMGISAATGLGAVAVDTMKAQDSPWDALDQKLRALGVTSYQEVEQAVTFTQKQGAALGQGPAPTPQDPQQRDRFAGIAAAVAPYVRQTFWEDLMTDGSGAALHRVQVFVWTIALGVIFVVGVYQNLTMPSFSPTLLALMAISGASYVGFKYPEKTTQPQPSPTAA